jgi:hypothetical protein
MTGDGACAGIRPALGVYVLGAAEPAERALVRLHLARCRDCREELAGLAGLPGLLRRVPAAEAEKLFAAEAEGDSHVDSLPVTALPQLLVRAARARRARRWLAVAVTAVAAVIAAGGAIAGQRAPSPPRPAVSSHIAWKTALAHSDLTLATATVRYAATAWGTELEVEVSGVAGGTACQLRVLGPGRQERPAGGWTIAGGQPDAWYPASTSLAASSIRGFSVTAGRKTLVTVPVSPSSQHPASSSARYPGGSQRGLNGHG